jgi:hypothetical protein
VLGAENHFADDDCSTEERFCFGRMTCIAQKTSEIVEAIRRSGMLGAERLFADRQRALEERLRRC